MILERLQRFTEPVSVLDHGSVQLLDVMGDDHDICVAARAAMESEGTHKWEEKTAVSGRPFCRCLLCGETAFESSPEWSSACREADRRTINRMIGGDPRHTTPFEQACIKLRVVLPIMVERQWVRHRTASHVERSGRKTPHLICYVPSLDRPGMEDQEEQQELLRLAQEDSLAHAFSLKSSGVPLEVARTCTSVGVYTAKVWTMDVKNLLDMLYLRLDGHAQWEIRQYAEVIADIIKIGFPLTWQAFIDHRFCSTRFSRQEMEDIIMMLEAHAVDDLGCWDRSSSLYRKVQRQKRRMQRWASKES